MNNSIFRNAGLPAVATRTGGVMMEVVVVLILIAAAAVVAVTIMGHTIIAASNVSGDAMSGRGESAGKNLACPEDGYRKQINDETAEAEKFPGEFSDVEN